MNKYLKLKLKMKQDLLIKLDIVKSKRKKYNELEIKIVYRGRIKRIENNGLKMKFFPEEEKIFSMLNKFQILQIKLKTLCILKK